MAPFTATNMNDDSAYAIPLKSGNSAKARSSSIPKAYPIKATVDTGKHGSGGRLSLRTEAGKTSFIVKRIPNSASIDVQTMEGAWLAARYGSAIGYVMVEYIMGSEAYGPDSNSSHASISQQIAVYSKRNIEREDHISVTQYFTNLDFYAAMRCASYLRICRKYRGGSGATTEYDNYAAMSSLKGTIDGLGGYDALIPGMEIFQASASASSRKAHIGVYYGLYDFGYGSEPGVYQSTTARTRLRAKYEDSNTEGPNLTQMNNRWTHWIWPRYIVQ